MSHEQIDFKKRHVYGLENPGETYGVKDPEFKTAQDEIDEMKQEMNQELVGAFKGRDAPDIHTLMVKQDQSELFGLRIENRTCPEVNHLFEFDIEEYVSLVHLRQMFKLPENVLISWTPS